MVSGLGPRGPYIRHTHVIPFEDHAGQPALSVFESASPLPFLYSFSFYLTHPDASPDTSNAAELYKTLTRGPLYDSDDVEHRLDIPLPRREGRPRPYRDQVDAVARDDAQPPAGDGGSRPPGLVASYAVHDKARFRYHGLLHICGAADWRRGGQDQLLTHFEFDPLSRGDYERYSKDPGDPREPDVLPETQRDLLHCASR